MINQPETADLSDRERLETSMPGLCAHCDKIIQPGEAWIPTPEHATICTYCIRRPDPTNRWRRGDKASAYEMALEIAARIANEAATTDLLWTPGPAVYIVEQIARQWPEMPGRDQRQVAAKAVRVTRGRRKMESRQSSAAEAPPVAHPEASR